MTDRVSRCRRIGEAYFEAYHCGVERGRIEHEDNFARNMVMSLPAFGEFVVPDFRAFAHDEFALYWTEIPDFRAEGLQVFPSEDAVAVFLHYEGTGKDGNRYGFHEADVMHVNPDGQVHRFEALIDSREWDGVLQLFGLSAMTLSRRTYADAFLKAAGRR